MSKDEIATRTANSTHTPSTEFQKPVTGTDVTGNKRALDSYIQGGAVTAEADTTSLGTPAGFTVSTTAVLLAALNANRKSLVITNNSTGKLYLGHTSGVTSSGAAMGLLVPSNGSYTDSGFGLYIGDMYGIYDASAGAQNVSVSERT